ncbi:MAG: hypothetical protein WCE54_19790 [Ignavibacteriaceae bacterium]
MKLLIIFIITIFYYTLAYSAPPDSLGTNQNQNNIEQSNQIGEKKGEDTGRRRGKKDAFIDKDGDGICDQRVKGMSFENAQRRHMQRNRGGKSGSGNTGGNGNQNGK